MSTGTSTNMPSNTSTNISTDRYIRQRALPEVGNEGQDLLKQSVIAIVGVGALGSVSAELLARAGIGRLILIDDDKVELNNLQRQGLYREADVGLPKALAAKTQLSAINSDVVVEAVVARITPFKTSLLDEADLILDGTDNLSTRLLLNEYAMREKVPFIYCAAVKSSGMVYTVNPSEKRRACLQCFLGKRRSADSCSESGVLNTTTHLAATIQTGEALKILLNKKSAEGLITIDAWKPSISHYSIKKQDDCQVCNGRFDLLEGRAPIVEFCASKKVYRARNIPAVQLSREALIRKGAVILEETLKRDDKQEEEEKEEKKEEKKEKEELSEIRFTIDGFEGFAYLDGTVELNAQDYESASALIARLLAD